MSREAAALAVLAQAAWEFGPAALASSLSLEDMVLADLIAREELPIGIFVLDTGRLHGDTLELAGKLEDRYGFEVAVYRPLAHAIEHYVARFGRDAFYESTGLRQQCCEIRKLEPLRRALAGKGSWITGLRRGQSAGRGAVAVQEFDALHGLAKFNPLADWSEQEVWSYLSAHDVPYNRLYDQGYRSIGCAPCTRPVTAGEDPRAGRWWWEAQGRKECGLHVAPVRIAAASRRPA
ncbi:MAG TPA: phosphoadenylyl-sulfate reductase [Burkholderiales bacterium]|nr:phosphoadenylyl-sulfate reductase [Burkholderiales bacterium]